MSFLSATGIQDPEDASLSDRLAIWILEQQQQHDFAQHARPRIGILAPMGYARDGGWPVYAGDAPTAYAPGEMLPIRPSLRIACMSWLLIAECC